MNEDERVERFGAILSLLYEFNWPMSETEISQQLMMVSHRGDLRSLLADLKKADLIADATPDSWKLTRKGKAMVRQSLGQSH
jgi:DNA-binding IclR family transcriptional regulator